MKKDYAIIDLDKTCVVDDNAWVCRVKRVSIPAILTEMHRRKIPKEMLTDSMAKEWFEQLMYEMLNKVWVEI